MRATHAWELQADRHVHLCICKAGFGLWQDNVAGSSDVPAGRGKGRSVRAEATGTKRSSKIVNGSTAVQLPLSDGAGTSVVDGGPSLHAHYVPNTC